MKTKSNYKSLSDAERRRMARYITETGQQSEFAFEPLPEAPAGQPVARKPKPRAANRAGRRRRFR